MRRGLKRYSLDFGGWNWFSVGLGPYAFYLPTGVRRVPVLGHPKGDVRVWRTWHKLVYLETFGVFNRHYQGGAKQWGVSLLRGSWHAGRVVALFQVTHCNRAMHDEFGEAVGWHLEVLGVRLLSRRMRDAD